MDVRHRKTAVLFVLFSAIAAAGGAIILHEQRGQEVAAAQYEELAENADNITNISGEEFSTEAGSVVTNGIVTEAFGQKLVMEESAEVQTVEFDAALATALEAAANEAHAEAADANVPVSADTAVNNDAVTGAALSDAEVFALYAPQANKVIDWSGLNLTVNPDIYAWITVPGTNIDYPMVQHPYDNVFYLNHNLDGSAGYPGCIYTENYNSKTFTDSNTVIYGHNLKNGTMFSKLHVFTAADLTNENHVFYIYTPTKICVYLVFAAYEFPAYHLVLNYDYGNIYAYEQYQQDILTGYGIRPGGTHNVRQGVTLTGTDRIVTLSTCTKDHNKAYRYLVAGKLIGEISLVPEEMTQ